MKQLTALLKIGGMLVCVEKEGEETKSRNILGVVRLNKKNRTLLTRVRLSESFHCRDLSIPKEEQQAQDEYLVEDTTEIDSEEHKVDTNEKEKKELHSKLDLLLRLH